MISNLKELTVDHDVTPMIRSHLPLIWVLEPVVSCQRPVQ